MLQPTHLKILSHFTCLFNDILRLERRRLGRKARLNTSRSCHAGALSSSTALRRTARTAARLCGAGSAPANHVPPAEWWGAHYDMAGRSNRRSLLNELKQMCLPAFFEYHESSAFIPSELLLKWILLSLSVPLQTYLILRSSPTCKSRMIVVGPSHHSSYLRDFVDQQIISFIQPDISGNLLNFR